ncbi:MAG: MoaF N-terminal domain-containing protein [Rhizobiaceae bacterium]|nr:MoaF N-terminal domain-containing protein [Rhizobiaceae bacterium]
MFDQKTIRISYDNGAIYRVEYLQGSRLRWTCLEGQDKGRSAEESYHAVAIAPGFWLVHWIETDGVAVTQVVQPEAASINTTIIIPAALAGSEKPLGLVLAGTISPA